MGLPQNTFVELSISNLGIFFVFLEKVFHVMFWFFFVVAYDGVRETLFTGAQKPNAFLDSLMF